MSFTDNCVKRESTAEGDCLECNYLKKCYPMEWHIPSSINGEEIIIRKGYERVEERSMIYTDSLTLTPKKIRHKCTYISLGNSETE